MDEAEKAFTRSLVNNKRNTVTMLELAELRYQRGDYPSAKAIYDRFLENQEQTAKSLLLGIKLMRAFEDRDTEASYALYLKNNFPYSKEYLEYKEMLEK